MKDLTPCPGKRQRLCSKSYRNRWKIEEISNVHPEFELNEWRIA